MSKDEAKDLALHEKLIFHGYPCGSEDLPEGSIVKFLYIRAGLQGEEYVKVMDKNGRMFCVKPSQLSLPYRAP